MLQCILILLKLSFNMYFYAHLWNFCFYLFFFFFFFFLSLLVILLVTVQLQICMTLLHSYSHPWIDILIVWYLYDELWWSSQFHTNDQTWQSIYISAVCGLSLWQILTFSSNLSDDLTPVVFNLCISPKCDDHYMHCSHQQLAWLGNYLVQPTAQYSAHHTGLCYYWNKNLKWCRKFTCNIHLGRHITFHFS